MTDGNRFRRRLAGYSLCAAGSALLAAPALAAQGDTPESVEALSSLSIEELAQIEVSSASKQAEPISGVPTAIFVITAEDIERSPATSLPEVLRMAPNLHVQRVDARQYAIGARGFNGIETSNKLLARIDGRSIYTTLASSIFWELNAPLLEDLAQVEVISGPGGTLYGPNAVNGVINITSRSAHDTIGLLARATAGPEEQTAALRYGAALGATGAVRVYANGFHRSGMVRGAGPKTDDNFKGLQAGFRADFALGGGNLTFQGDVFDTQSDLLAGDGDRGGNVLARWSRPLGAAASFQVQAYYDRFSRRSQLVRDSLETFDIEVQLNRAAGGHELVAGGGLRTTHDNFVNNLNPFRLNPESRRLWVANAFLQDRIALSDTFALIAGAKIEGSTFAGVEILPNLRLAWQPAPRTLVWAAVSRAARSPSRIDRQLEFLPILAQAPEFRSEKLIAIEAGYRGQPSQSTTLSVSAFYNLYDDIRTTQMQPGGLLPIQLMNGLAGSSYGIEAWGTRQLTSWWRASLGGFLLGKDYHLKNGAVDLANRASLGADPDFQLLARSSIDFGPRVLLDLAVRGQDDLNESGVAGYVQAEARLGWRPADGLEIYLAGNNLLHKTHAESLDTKRAQLSERSLYLGTRVRF